MSLYTEEIGVLRIDLSGALEWLILMAGTAAISQGERAQLTTCIERGQYLMTILGEFEAGRIPPAARSAGLFDAIRLYNDTVFRCYESQPSNNDLETYQ